MSQTKIKRRIKKQDLWKAKVACIIPNNRPMDEMFRQSYEDMLVYARKQDVFAFTVPIQQMSAVHRARNAPLAALIKSEQPFSHVLMIDDDIVVQPDALVRLVNRKVDIVGAATTTRGWPPTPTARVFREDHWEEVWHTAESGLVEVDGIGTGMILMTLNAIQQVAEVWFNCLVEKDVYGVSEEWVKRVSEERLKAFDETANAWWFRFIDFDAVTESGEDMSFCLKASKYAGLKVYVDTEVEPGHLGAYPWGMKDARIAREQMIRKSVEAGRAKVEREQSQIVVVE